MKNKFRHAKFATKFYQNQLFAMSVGHADNSRVHAAKIWLEDAQPVGANLFWHAGSYIDSALAMDNFPVSRDSGR